MTWHPETDQAHATQLEVRFSARLEGGCQVDLVHDGWHARSDAEAARERYDSGWIDVLQRFMAAATADQETS